MEWKYYANDKNDNKIDRSQRKRCNFSAVKNCQSQYSWVVWVAFGILSLEIRMLLMPQHVFLAGGCGCVHQVCVVIVSLEVLDDALEKAIIFAQVARSRM